MPVSAYRNFQTAAITTNDATTGRKYTVRKKPMPCGPTELWLRWEKRTRRPAPSPAEPFQATVAQAFARRGSRAAAALSRVAFGSAPPEMSLAAAVKVSEKNEYSGVGGRWIETWA